MVRFPNRPPRVGPAHKERAMKKLVVLAVALALAAASLFVIPAVESPSSQVFSRVGQAGAGQGE